MRARTKYELTLMHELEHEKKQVEAYMHGRSYIRNW